MKIWLEPLGEIVVCNHGLEAWHTILNDARFDLIVTDHEMPGLSGKELVQKVRAEKTFDSIPVIMVSASINPADAIELKIHSFLEKPVSPETLISASRIAMTGSKTNFSGL